MDNDRLMHSIAVARKMVSIGKSKGMSEIELQELFILGLNHDIGYEFSGGDNHGINGAKALKSSGYKYYKEVYYHGIVQDEYNSVYLTILNQADMQIDKYGNDVGYDSRLEDIKSRYGSHSRIYNECLELVNKIRSL